MITLYLLYKLLSGIRFTPSRRRRTVTNRTVTTKTVYTLGIKAGPARTVQRDAERIRHEQFKRSQAAADLVHYKQVKADLLKAYDAAQCDGNSEKQIKKRIAYDNAIRRTEKQIENAAYNARRPGL